MHLGFLLWITNLTLFCFVFVFSACELKHLKTITNCKILNKPRTGLCIRIVQTHPYALGQMNLFFLFLTVQGVLSTGTAFCSTASGH